MRVSILFTSCRYLEPTIIPTHRPTSGELQAFLHLVFDSTTSRTTLGELHFIPGVVQQSDACFPLVARASLISHQ